VVISKEYHIRDKEMNRKKIYDRTDVNVGKKGITEELVEEIRQRFKKNSLLKIRVNRNLLKTGLSIKDVAQELANKTDSRVVEIRGHVIVLEYLENR
jgi:RNA-binding protein